MESTQKSRDSHSESNESLGNTISRLAAHIHAANYRLLVMIREFDQREAWADLGLKSCAHWLNWRCGTSLHTGREKVRVAHALAELPKISAAFERGQLSYSKVRAVTRVANTDNEKILLNIALSGTAAQLERLVRCEIRNTCESKAESNARVAFEKRSFGWHDNGDGSVTFHGSLPAELAARLIGALESFEVGEGAEDDIESESAKKHTEQASAEALSVDKQASADAYCVDRQANAATDLVNKTSGVGTNTENEEPTGFVNEPEFGSPIDQKSVPAETRTLSQRRADALVALADQSFNGYQVMLHVPAGNSSGSCRLDPGGTIPYAAAERICCDASIVPVLEGESGELLDIGRKTRKILPGMRRALGLRDKGTCQFPGCSHTRYLHRHHIEHWAHGGKTALDNLVLLCSHHHGLVHEGGFKCVAIKRAGVKGVNTLFRRPDGVIMPPAFALTSVPGTLESEQRQIETNDRTCSASDFGTSLDVGVVLDALEFRRRREDRDLL